MKKFVLLIFLSTLAATINAQSVIKKYVQQNVQEIKSINPSDTDYTDLEAIATAIGDARMVLLGEQDHGDAPTFLAKTRLIKFLHEKKGFDILLFESDFYSLTSGWKAFEQNEFTISHLINGNVFTIWTQCNACTDLFQYIKQTQTSTAPVIVGGFDNQLHGIYRRDHYKKEMTERISALPIKEAGYYAQRLSRLLDTAQLKYPLLPPNLSADSLILYGQLLDSLESRLVAIPDSSYSKILVQNLRSVVYKDIYTLKKSNETMTVRDRQMAANIEWLYRNKLNDKKIIIWAANYHVAKNVNDAYNPNDSGRFITMGSFLSEKFGDSLYILGFNSYEGSAGRVTMPKTYDVTKPVKNSFEKWIYSPRREYAFLDFKNFRKQYPGTDESFFMKGKSHYYGKYPWTNIFDGIFYIQTMYPCKKLN